MNLFFSENDIIFFKVKRFICAWEKAASDGSLFLCLNGVFKSKNHSWRDTWGDIWRDIFVVRKTKCFSWGDTWGDTFN